MVSSLVVEAGITVPASPSVTTAESGAESADHGHRVLAQVGVGEAGGDRAPHPRRRRAHRLGVGHRDRRGLDEVGQGQPLAAGARRRAR